MKNTKNKFFMSWTALLAVSLLLSVLFIGCPNTGKGGGGGHLPEPETRKILSFIL
ncbi:MULTISPECIES: hypothetical protein [unclassified Treponema]|uniref:hypothetical protein n=1 Tax=unclassified Treponema TaxID=2638727 RepID=UPI0020A3C0FD|nr:MULTISPECIES: hypothetical protein [unclassified Treponema]UTC67537.1 hypothetical protein E4O06_02365 [Treponema sp. OMZ 789]UTC70265.1 hypothetical protein E4O01_02355 [Treponema sp. OMZ 790]UTC72980.1 hypothetical protein E4O02_02355 [Treponema sp. OMZ 791]